MKAKEINLTNTGNLQIGKVVKKRKRKTPKKDTSKQNTKQKKPNVVKRIWRLFVGPKSRRFKVISALLIILLTTATVLGIQYVVIPGLAVKDSAESILLSLNNLQADIANKDLTRLQTTVDEVTLELDAISTEIDKYEFLQTLEITQGYYENLQIIKRLIKK